MILCLLQSKVEEFLGLTCSTMQSYVDAYHNDWPQEETNESGFILALCGTITSEFSSFRLWRWWWCTRMGREGGLLGCGRLSLRFTHCWMRG